jgi:DNA-binding NarL/FixJ family response regulator
MIRVSHPDGSFAQERVPTLIAMPELAGEPRRRVVIADDDPLYVRYLATLVEANDGFEVVGLAANGEEAVQLAVWQNADVVLMDIDMPKIDGLRATQLLRKSRRRVCVLLVSGLDEEQLEEARTVGAAAVIAKATGPEAIERTLAAVAAGSRGEQTGS